MIPLLEPDEAPAVEVFNPGGRADLLIICDHASRAVPRALGDLGLPSTAFDRHIAALKDDMRDASDFEERARDLVDPPSR